MSTRDLYKMIENLNHKIKKLDSQVKNKNFNLLPNPIKSSNQTIFRAYGINYPKTYDKNKKYVGLLFDENFNDFTSENNDSSNSKIPFIKLSNGNNIINYSFIVDIEDNKLTNQFAIQSIQSNLMSSISLGIREKSNSKVKIIKGSKITFDIKNQINNKIVINNTIIYNSNAGEELCMIAELNPKCKINSGKSLFKILTI